MKKEFLECGRILAPHGVKGLVKIESWCDSPKVLSSMKRIFFAEGEGKFREAKVLSASVMGQTVLMSVEGIEDREYAQGLKNTTLYLKREDIPLKKGAYFLADVIGLEAKDFDTGRLLGTVKDITDAARGKLYVIDTGNGEVLIPDTADFIRKVDVDDAIYIKPIPGFFTDI